MAALRRMRGSPQFRLLVQGVTDYAIYMLDPQGNVSSWNVGAQRIKGYAPREIIGQHFSRFYTEEDKADDLPRKALETAANEGRFEKEGWRVRKDGTRFWPQAAGLAMLPMAFPLFLVPRIVAAHLTQRFSGRTLLTLGLSVLAMGMLVLFLVASSSQYCWMLPGMLTAGIGAGVLNGETTKVGMTVIPPERAGMAAGVGGTVRFTGIVVGIAALGAILFSKVAAKIAALVPNLSDLQQAQITQAIISGDISPVSNGGILSDIVRHSLGVSYQTLFLTSALIAGGAAVAAWMLVKEMDTAAHR